MQRILLIGNDAGLEDVLNGGQFHVDYADSEAQAVNSVAFSEPDLILLDVVAVDGNLSSLCKRVRQFCAAPLVVCSTNGGERDVVRALEAGVDEYLVLPIRPVELSARLRALLRRAGDKRPSSSSDRRLIAGDIEIRLDEKTAFRRGVALALSPIEFKLLTILIRDAGRAVSHAKLMAQVWGPEYVDSRHYLRLYVRYLRSKLEDDPKNPELILNEWGVGYRFEPQLT